MLCPGCQRSLVPRHNVSIPECIICYKAGEPDPLISGNRLVTEWDCPTTGRGVYSPGGGVSTPNYGSDFPCRKIVMLPEPSE